MIVWWRFELWSILCKSVEVPKFIEASHRASKIYLQQTHEWLRWPWTDTPRIGGERRSEQGWKKKNFNLTTARTAKTGKKWDQKQLQGHFAGSNAVAWLVQENVIWLKASSSTINSLKSTADTRVGRVVEADQGYVASWVSGHSQWIENGVCKQPRPTHKTKLTCCGKCKVVDWTLQQSTKPRCTSSSESELSIHFGSLINRQFGAGRWKA